MTSLAQPDVAFGPDGLVPAVVQDAADGRVLMVAYMDAEALAATVATGEVHFHSRSRGRLWRKGETSGNVLRLVGLATDCDSDALLVTVDPVGPTCHRGTRSCFDADGAPAGRDGQGFAWLETLWATIESRAADRPAGSYTAELLAGGVDAVARKVTEEATEVLMAAKDDAAAEAGADLGARPATRSPGKRRTSPRTTRWCCSGNVRSRPGRSSRCCATATGPDRIAIGAMASNTSADTIPGGGTSRMTGRSRGLGCRSATLGSTRSGPGFRPAIIRTTHPAGWPRTSPAGQLGASRPTSRRRLPILTSSHSPAMSSGTNSRIRHPRSVDRHAAGRDRPPRFAA